MDKCLGATGYEQDTRDELGITNVQISKAHFMEALGHYPLNNTVQLQNLRGPSYIYAIVMDKRICQGR
ncbi:MAG TPA: hypothetical protein VMV58_00410 [Desulfosporosinus sp.]|nr:hypothetical protein [Desulfosporosinus sp.]